MARRHPTTAVLAAVPTSPPTVSRPLVQRTLRSERVMASARASRRHLVQVQWPSHERAACLGWKSSTPRTGALLRSQPDTVILANYGEFYQHALANTTFRLSAVADTWQRCRNRRVLAGSASVSRQGVMHEH